MCVFIVDRYIMICYLFKVEWWCKFLMVWKMIVGVFVVGLLFNVICFFEYEFLEIIVLINDINFR